VHAFGCSGHPDGRSAPVPKELEAVFVRNRVLNHLSWPAEKGSIRRQRRQALCELDGLLSQLEEMNLRGTEVPGRVRAALRRHGAVVSDKDGAAQLIEVIFAVQERYMLHPQLPPPPAVEDLRRRMAS
jgi:hypothetical protein